jgi:hypothetical protein
MHVLESKADLDEPVHDLILRKDLAFLSALPNVVSQVPLLAKLHDDNQHAFLNEGVFV